MNLYGPTEAAVSVTAHVVGSDDTTSVPIGAPEWNTQVFVLDTRLHPVLAICAAIQVLGNWYETSSGERVDGVSMLDVTTSPQEKRSIGEVITKPLIDGLTAPLSGFENHRGGTTLGSSASGFARVTHGVGNGVGDGFEGVVQGSVIGTYMHGPALAQLIQLVVGYRSGCCVTWRSSSCRSNRKTAYPIVDRGPR